MGRMVARNYRTTQQPTGDVVHRLGSSEKYGTTVSAETLWVGRNYQLPHFTLFQVTVAE